MHSLLQTQKCGIIPGSVVRPGWFFDVPASHDGDCARRAEQCTERSARAARCDYPLVIHASARYGACTCIAIPRLRGYLWRFDLHHARSNLRRRSWALRSRCESLEARSCIEVDHEVVCRISVLYLSFPSGLWVLSVLHICRVY